MTGERKVKLRPQNPWSLPEWGSGRMGAVISGNVFHSPTHPFVCIRSTLFVL